MLHRPQQSRNPPRQTGRMTRKNRLLLTITTALIAAGALAAVARPEPRRTRPIAADGTVPEVVVTARGPNTVVKEIVVRARPDLARTTSAREALN